MLRVVETSPAVGKDPSTGLLESIWPNSDMYSN